MACKEYGSVGRVGEHGGLALRAPFCVRLRPSKGPRSRLVTRDSRLGARRRIETDVSQTTDDQTTKPQVPVNGGSLLSSWQIAGAPPAATSLLAMRVTATTRLR